MNIRTFSDLIYEGQERLFHPLAHFGAFYGKLFLERKNGYVPFMPRAVYLDILGLCNLHCEMCFIRLLPRRQPSFLSFDNFKKIIEQFQPRQTRRFVINGLGEPLFNPDLIEMLKYARERGFQTEIFTNGTLIDKHNVKDLVTNLNCVHFSIDGCKKETYEAIRKGAHFNEVIDNISLFTKNCKKLNSRVDTWINFVAMSSNHREIVDAVSLAHKLRIKNVQISMAKKNFAVEDMPSYNQKMNGLLLKYKQISNLLKEAHMLSKKFGIRFWFEPSTHFASACTWPWWGCFILRDGFVTPCCKCPDPSVINFGNVFSTPFSEIWNNSMYREFRRKLMSANVPHICKKCGF
jgi:radical SAM protein with 4Fe4S-binding SPASM domain